MPASAPAVQVAHRSRDPPRITSVAAGGQPEIAPGQSKAMRVLHTSDWHLGLSTGPVSRAAEHAEFLRWLTETIRDLRVDALVVAGDVFDTVSPSAESLRLYYGWLAGLAETGVGTVVIVGGNHDSQARLEAPRELLDAIDVHVVGGLPTADDGLDRMIVPLRRRRPRRGDPPGPVEAVCLAVPYVHEWRLGIRTTDDDPLELAEAFRARFGALYRELTDRAEAAYPDLPMMATGHLTVGREHTPEDYPQEIHQVGSIAALPPSVFDRRLRYVALGHVHRCYPVADGRVWYCGTPIATSVAERTVPRRVLLVELDAHERAARGSRQTLLPLEWGPTVEKIDVPQWRALEVVEGPLEAVEAELSALAAAAAEGRDGFGPLVFVRVHTSAIIPDLRKRLAAHLVAAPEARRPVLVELREVRGNDQADDDEHEPLPVLEDLAPIDVFRRLCEAAGVDPSGGLERAFSTLTSLSDEQFAEFIDEARP